MAPSTCYDPGELWELSKGTLNFGGFNLTWDFTGGLSKEQWARKREAERTGVYQMQNGRVLMPALGIL